MKKKLGGVALVVILLLAVPYFLFPGFVFNLAQRAARHCAGLEKKAVRAGNDRIVYLEGGKGETVLLLHGYTCNKDFWVQFAKWLTPDYHVVIPDLPGFGDSTKRFDKNYNLDSQVLRIDRFARVLHLKKFHLVGHSMGGAIAALYAARFPQQLSTLALLDPAGVLTAKKSEFLLQWEKGVNILLIGSLADFQRALAVAYVKPPSLPGAFEKVLVAQAMANRKINEKIGHDIANERQALEPLLPRIQAPTLIVWGDQDRIIDISSVPILEKGLKSHRTVILKQTGHMPMIEKPAETAAAYTGFLKNRPGRQEFP